MLTSLCLAAVLLVAACHKTGHHKQPTPEAAKKLRLGWNLKTTVEAFLDLNPGETGWYHDYKSFNHG